MNDHHVPLRQQPQGAKQKFAQIRISIASRRDQIRECPMSRVRKPEDHNYRTSSRKDDAAFCAKIWAADQGLRVPCAASQADVSTRVLSAETCVSKVSQ